MPKHKDTHITPDTGFSLLDWASARCLTLLAVHLVVVRDIPGFFLYDDLDADGVRKS